MADEVSVLAIGWNDVGGFLYLVFDRLSPQAPRGIWRIQSITTNDKGQNLRIYYASDPLLARGQFLVK